MPVIQPGVRRQGPTCWERVKLGFGMGFAVGLSVGVLFGGFQALRYVYLLVTNFLQIFYTNLLTVNCGGGILMKLYHNVGLNISDNFENGSCWFKNYVTTCRSNFTKPCVHSRGHTFSPILLKVGQNVCLDDIRDKFENWSRLVKKLVTGSNLRKSIHRLWRPHFQ